MIASPVFAKRCYVTAALVLLVTTLASYAVEEPSLQSVTSTQVPILEPVADTGLATIRSSATVPTVRVLDVEPSTSTIRVILPTSWSEEAKVEAPQAKAAAPQEELPACKVYRAEPIGVEPLPSNEVVQIGPTGVAADRPLQTIQFLNTLTANWNKTPSPFKDETVTTAPNPAPPSSGAKAAESKAADAKDAPPAKLQVKPLPATQRQRTPAPIESKTHSLAPPESGEPSEPGASLNDDLPYYKFDESCGTAVAKPCRIPQERMQQRLFRGPARQPMMQQGQCMNGQCETGQCTTGQCTTGQCPPYQDPWGPGHWVGPGVWMPTNPAPGIAQACDDGVYGWGPPRRLFRPQFLEKHGITLGGWIDQGYTYNDQDPGDRYNGPVTFNDRSADYQMNQFDVFLEKEVDGSGSGLEVGGRVDVLFGTDARFTEAAGWETNWDMNERFYRLSVPQMYADFGWRDWTVRMGHFYTTIGYESVPAVNNFFYSHSYSMQYAEPFTHTGMQAFRQLNSQLKFNVGFNRGWDQFNGIDGCDRLSILTGANWVSRDGRFKFDFALTAGPQAPDNSTVMYSMVGTYLPCGWLEYVLQHDYGQSTGGNPNGVRFAEWYSLNQYLFVTLNERWKVGVRAECFCDKQGVRVHGLGQGNLAAGPYPGDFWEVTMGLNWEPRKNIRIRPEARWDWYSATGTTANKPFDGGNSNNQFLLGVDAIIQF